MRLGLGWRSWLEIVFRPISRVAETPRPHICPRAKSRGSRTGAPVIVGAGWTPNLNVAHLCGDHTDDSRSEWRTFSWGIVGFINSFTHKSIYSRENISETKNGDLYGPDMFKFATTIKKRLSLVKLVLQQGIHRQWNDHSVVDTTMVDEFRPVVERMWRITGFVYPVRSSQVSAKSHRPHSAVNSVPSSVADGVYALASSDEIRGEERRWNAGTRTMVDNRLRRKPTFNDLRLKR